MGVNGLSERLIGNFPTYELLQALLEELQFLFQEVAGGRPYHVRHLDEIGVIQWLVQLPYIKDAPHGVTRMRYYQAM
ncbi:hypothetical protein ES703_37770 [subsurface metagenome]